MRSRAAVLAVACALLGLAGLARAETVQRAGLRVSFAGKLTPNALPRSRPAPVSVSVSAKVASSTGEAPPPLRRMTIAINRYGQLDRGGLPVCRLDQIQPATTGDALAACRRSLVGEGRFRAKVQISGVAPFPADGKVYAFNGEVDGRPAILAHVYGTQPAPASYTLAFLISRTRGTFGTTLTATLPPVTAGAGYMTAISLNLGKSFTVHGRRHSYLNASCAAPKGFTKAPFSFARASVSFQGGPTLATTLVRTCRAKG